MTCTGASEPNAGGARPYAAVAASRRGMGAGQERCSCKPGGVGSAAAAIAAASTEEGLGLDGDELSDELGVLLRVLRACCCCICCCGDEGVLMRAAEAVEEVGLVETDSSSAWSWSPSTWR